MKCSNVNGHNMGKSTGDVRGSRKSASCSPWSCKNQTWLKQNARERERYIYIFIGNGRKSKQPQENITKFSANMEIKRMKMHWRTHLFEINKCTVISELSNKKAAVLIQEGSLVISPFWTGIGANPQNFILEGSETSRRPGRGQRKQNRCEKHESTRKQYYAVFSATSWAKCHWTTKRKKRGRSIYKINWKKRRNYN